MAWAVFHEPFSFDRRPKFAVAFEITENAEPQEYPSDVIDAAVKAGKAKRVNSPAADEKRAVKRAKRAG